MKNKLKFILIIAFGFFMLANLFAQKHENPPIKALYVDDFFSSDSSEIILGIEEAEQALFDYAENCGFNYLILYGLSAVPLGSNPESVEALKSFVKRAHEQYEIKLGCVGQSSKFFKRIHEKYQSLDTVAAIERLDSYNLEFEFWKSYHSGVYLGYYCENYLEPNSYSCDSIGAFEFAMDELNKIDSLSLLLSDTSIFAETTKVETEIYIGWINEYHAEVLAQKIQDSVIDRILGAVYKTALEDGSLNLYQFYHQTRRLGFLGTQGNTIPFLPIFAVKESQGNHLGDWLDTIGSIPLAWEHYYGEFESDTANYTENILLNGFVWYNHSHMPLCFDSIHSYGEITGPEGELLRDSIYSFQLIDYQNTDRFYWELPYGVTFADSSHWNDQVNLQFHSYFNEGDSIAVRAANKCHLGKRQYFQIKKFNALEELKQDNTEVYYKDGLIHIKNCQIEAQAYEIWSISGQLLQKGTFIGNTIHFKYQSGIYFIRFANNRESFKFLVH